jgi:CHAD domain-containing protein
VCSSDLAVLDGDRYLALLVALGKLVDAPELTGKAKKPAAVELRKVLRKADDRLRASVAGADAATGPERDLALHQARKDAKKARYTLDAVKPVFGKEVKGWRTGVKAVQTALGVHQDAVNARTALRDIGVRAHLDGDNAFTYGLLWAREDARAHAAEAEFVEAWAALGAAKKPRWLS